MDSWEPSSTHHQFFKMYKVTFTAVKASIIPTNLATSTMVPDFVASTLSIKFFCTYGIKMEIAELSSIMAEIPSSFH